ncbi:hypothetical protein G6O69_17335 [Pseudenhygromyxa sp. WMMC2535]|uniref:hypothetical protein n=1 Tax=Pseudenhygromyxa sp. WMMC2535 TaxID=2712867 RepID=UPI001555B994|nr:hypothetical protein [Pseudenhygromyxa sp. WMMC2535]NVB39609.1 hypothetical protein [Pseudenhygromyxa sp. WMMC2535]
MPIKSRLRIFLTSLALAGLGAQVALAPAPAAAHLAKWGSWEITHRNLMKLFPDADPNAWRIKRYQYSDKEVAVLERELGFALYPEDKTPEFYVAHDSEGRFLGVAIFIDPRTKPKVLDGSVLTLEVGVGVDARGKIDRVRVYDYRGDLRLTKREFLSQLEGRGLDSEFHMGEGGLVPVSGEPEESQLVANAGREALLLMKVALGKG